MEAAPVRGPNRGKPETRHASRERSLHNKSLEGKQEDEPQDENTRLIGRLFCSTFLTVKKFCVFVLCDLVKTD